MTMLAIAVTLSLAIQSGSLRDLNETDRLAAFERVATSAGAGVSATELVDAVEHSLSSNNARLRKGACEATMVKAMTTRVPSPSEYETLHTLLGRGLADAVADGDKEVRYACMGAFAALSVVGRGQKSSMAPSAAAVLVSAYWREADEKVARAILQSLIGTQAPRDDVAPVLKSALVHQMPSMRAIAATGVGRYRLPGATALIVPLLDDPDEGVRIAAATALSPLATDSQGAISALRARLQIEQNPTVARVIRGTIDSKP